MLSLPPLKITIYFIDCQQKKPDVINIKLGDIKPLRKEERGSIFRRKHTNRKKEC